MHTWIIAWPPKITNLFWIMNFEQPAYCRGDCPLSQPSNAYLAQTPPRPGPGSFQEWAKTKYTNSKIQIQKYLDHCTCDEHEENNALGLHGAVNRFLLSVHHIQEWDYCTTQCQDEFRNLAGCAAGFVFSSEGSDQLYFSHFSTFRFVVGDIWLFLG